MNKMWALFLLLGFINAQGQEWNPQKGKQYLILSEQAKSRVAIVDIHSQTIVWEWHPATQQDVAKEHAGWFGNMSDAKPVKNGKYILACASGGGVALIRIADKKTVFYAYAGGNTHSVELLPDGNIVSASSTGNLMRLFMVNKTDIPESVQHKDYYLYDGHNVVWDAKRKALYTVSDDQFKTYRYNSRTIELVLVDSTAMPDGHAHDLYWAYGNKSLWYSSGDYVFSIPIPSKKAVRVNTKLNDRIKSISSGPDKYPTVVIQPKESWWTDEVFDLEGNSVLSIKGLKIYKARWLL